MGDGGFFTDERTIPMAEAASAGGVLASAVAYTIAAVTAVVSGVWNAVTRDGTVPAFVRHGADEVGMALKAFPESIQTSEVGSILNPTQGEIASSRKPASLRSPAAIARDKGPYGQAPAPSQDIAPKTPSEIARDKGAASVHGQARGNVHGQGREGM
jgi:hypothetical protein